MLYGKEDKSADNIKFTNASTSKQSVCDDEMRTESPMALLMLIVRYC